MIRYLIETCLWVMVWACFTEQWLFFSIGRRVISDISSFFVHPTNPDGPTTSRANQLLFMKSPAPIDVFSCVFSTWYWSDTASKEEDGLVWSWFFELFSLRFTDWVILFPQDMCSSLSFQLYSLFWCYKTNWSKESWVPRHELAWGVGRSRKLSMSWVNLT